MNHSSKAALGLNSSSTSGPLWRSSYTSRHLWWYIGSQAVAQVSFQHSCLMASLEVIDEKRYDKLGSTGLLTQTDAENRRLVQLIYSARAR